MAEGELVRGAGEASRFERGPVEEWERFLRVGRRGACREARKGVARVRRAAEWVGSPAKAEDPRWRCWLAPQSHIPGLLDSLR